MPDSLQCASFKISKLYDISEFKSDVLALYKCKAWFTSVKCSLQVKSTVYNCKVQFTSAKCSLQVLSMVYKCKAWFTSIKHGLQV